MGLTPGMNVRCVFCVRVRRAHVKLYRVIIWSDQWRWSLPAAVPLLRLLSCMMQARQQEVTNDTGGKVMTQCVCVCVTLLQQVGLSVFLLSVPAAEHLTVSGCCLVTV